MTFLLNAVILAPILWGVHKLLNMITQAAFEQGFELGARQGFRHGHACGESHAINPGKVKDGRMELDLNDRRGGMN